MNASSRRVIPQGRHRGLHLRIARACSVVVTPCRALAALFLFIGAAPSLAQQEVKQEKASAGPPSNSRGGWLSGPAAYLMAGAARRPPTKPV